MAKVGRNDPCPCGSGKKFKRCHGSVQHQANLPLEAVRLMDHAKAREVQRQRQQGAGRPIVSTEAFGQRFVAVKNRLLHSEKWKTFHDFLFAYIKDAMGPEWGTQELSKPIEHRHPILVWYQRLCEMQAAHIKEPGKVSSMPATGATTSYLRLSYDLYSLDHNAQLQQKLINRLRDTNNFPGARYEVFVAATLVRAGFTIEFENEDDRNTTHCEFTARCSATGRLFSIEAKHRAGNKFRLGRQLNRALRKQAKYERIIFIDINVPDVGEGKDVPAYLLSAIADLRAFEGRTINGAPLPRAYIVVTNNPWHHHPDSVIVRCSALADGFQIPDYKRDVAFPTLRAAIDARERHTEIFSLLASMADHSDVPSTFDGEIPEFAFGAAASRLLVGQRYIVQDQSGKERIGLLATATVSEGERKAHCALSMDDGASAIYTWPLSDDEMAAWRKHPDTFFGTVGQRSTKAETPLKLYDFFYSSYQHTQRERLLELMAQASDIDKLRTLDQKSLASVYAERTVYGFLEQTRVAPKPSA